MKRAVLVLAGLLVLLAIGGRMSGTSTPAMWAADRIIDVHGHIGTFRGYDLSAETLLDNITRYGIRMVLVSNIDGAHLPGTTRDLDETAANDAALEEVQRHPDCLRALAWIRPMQGGSAEKVEPYLRDHGFVGMKFHPEMNQFPADASEVDPYLALCQKYGVPAVFHTGAPGSNSGPERIYAAARRFPSVAVVLYHMTFFGDHETSIRVVSEAMSKKDANLYLETAQAEPEAVLRAVKEVGADRVLFGTDATYFGADHYSKYVAMIDLLRRELVPEDFKKVTRENAIRLFKLEDLRSQAN